LKGVGQFGVEAPLRALFENHPAKRRQQPGGKLGLRGFELLAPRQLQDCRQIRYRLWGIETLMQGLWRHRGLGVALPEDVTQPSQGDRRVVQHCRRHQGKKILPRHLAAGPLEKVALTGEALETLWGKHAGEFLFDFPRKLFRLSVHRHEDSPS
jgi:hypothetical protein